MNSFQLNVDPKDLQYGRLVSAVIGTLRAAVRRRQDEGATRAEVARRIGCDRSQLSRVLNGNVGNLTLRTISDILWAAQHEPGLFSAQAYEDLSPNYVEQAWRAVATLNREPAHPLKIVPTEVIQTQATTSPPANLRIRESRVPEDA